VSLRRRHWETVTVTDLARPTGTLVGLLSDLREFVRAYRAHRKTLRRWRRMRPEQQLAFFLTVIASSPQTRDAFRRALGVKGIPDSQQPKAERRLWTPR
jgi:hypothetical protein